MLGASPLILGWAFETGERKHDLLGTWIWMISVYPGLGHVTDPSPCPFR